jgi:hypothetical protein
MPSTWCSACARRGDRIRPPRRVPGRGAGNGSWPLPRSQGDRMINSSLRELSAALAAKKVSAVELATLFLDRIDRLNPGLNAFIALDREQTLAQARAADGSESGKARGANSAIRRWPASPGAQGYFLHQGLAHQLRLAHAGELRLALRRPRGRKARRRRHGHAGQAQHGRVRHGLVQRNLVFRPGEEPLGHRPRARRLLGRLGCRDCRAPGAGRHRHRHRRLDPPAGGPVRPHRPQAHLRRGQPLRHDRLRLQPRPGRADGQVGRGLRAAAQRHGRLRHARFDLAGTPGRGLLPRP